MKIKSNTIEDQKRLCETFAKKFDISLSEIYQEANKYYEENEERVIKDLDDEDAIRKAKHHLKVKSLIRGRSAYKGRALKEKRVRKNGISSFLLIRFRDQDFSKRAWEKVNDYIYEKKLSDVEAQQQGLMDKDGNFLYTSLTTSFEDQYGKVINKDMIMGSAIGFFENKNKDGQIEYEARFVKFGFANNKYVPICRPAKIEITEGNTSGPLLDKNIYFLNTAVNENNEMLASLSLGEQINSLCQNLLNPEFLVDTYDEVIDLAESFVEEHEKWGYIGVFATCSNIGQVKPGDNIPVEFEIYDDDDDVQTITTFVPPKHFEGMCILEGESGFLFLVNPYISSKDNEIHFHLGGFMPIAGE